MRSSFISMVGGCWIMTSFFVLPRKERNSLPLGANRQLQELYEILANEQSKNKLIHYCTDRGITWHFSPPSAPHFGGLWEAGVKSFKTHLHRTVGDTLFTYEQLNTYVIEIEAILNSRPITPLSSDPNDLDALTPNHFLIGGLLANMPEKDFVDTSSNRLSTWQHIYKVKQHFWKRWYKEYLNEITTRKKWHVAGANTFKIGDLIVLKEDNLPPLRWALGRIIALHPGDDGIIRVATVKTAAGTYVRCVKRLCPLPIETTTQTN
ncbi:hypothetical protein KPH14_000886 [Odynerus spinipes]|uniref:DUF5641 domain-containing protein n=1 Tax=Odynerus spinipes TaxID=1348599 RepID=A0AAD9VLM3_9HYME|nr:hypothetical protein KPH14_000886 [Odynerus spinipes]